MLRGVHRSHKGVHSWNLKNEIKYFIFERCGGPILVPQVYRVGVLHRSPLEGVHRSCSEGVVIVVRRFIVGF
jgi:hypothetical protein